MLTPKQLRDIVETMQPILDELNGWITRDIVRRVMARLGRGEALELTNTDIWQAQVYADIGGHMEALQRQLVAFTRATEQEVAAIFREAGLTSYKVDAMVLQSGSVDVPPLPQSRRVLQVLADTYRRTNSDLYNFTRTTAMESQKRLIKALDEAHLKVMSGAQSYTAAVKDAVEALAQGQARVAYPTGHTDTLETAVLRAVRTGTAQASGNMSLELMAEHDWDIVLTSAHIGARYGDGGENPGNHYWWQGRFFSRTGRTPGLPLFVESTGYGTGEGLCGWNCRHSFGPGDGKHNPWKHFDSDENKRAYDLSQQQRKMEAAIRRSKHKLLTYREAIDNCQDPATRQQLQSVYDAEALKLQKQNQAYGEFCDDNDLKRLNDRLAVAQWNRSQAAKATAAAKRAKP